MAKKNKTEQTVTENVTENAPAAENAVDMPDAVTEQAPSQQTGKRGRGRPVGSKNAPKTPAATLHADRVSVVNDVLYVELAGDAKLTLRYNGGAVEASLPTSIVNADYVKAVGAILASAPASPVHDNEVIPFCQRLGIAQVPDMHTVYNWTVK